MGIYSAIALSIILVTLNNVMEFLEDPFEQIGVDDFNISVITEPSLMMYKPLSKKGTGDQLRVSEILSVHDDTSYSE